MKKILLPCLFIILFICQINTSASEGRFMHDPDINKNKIVFTYEGDLWIVNSSGGTAERITTNPGDENSAKFSPDGLSITFYGNYDGSNNIYVMPSEGGEPKELLTYPDFLCLSVGPLMENELSYVPIMKIL
jgi:tricorn protease